MRIAAACLALVFASFARAELFVTSTYEPVPAGTYTNLVIPAGNSIILQGFSEDLRGPATYITSSSNFEINTMTGTTTSVGVDYFTGPCTLSFELEVVPTNSPPIGVLYKMIPSQPYRSTLNPLSWEDANQNIIYQNNEDLFLNLLANQKITILGVRGASSGTTASESQYFRIKIDQVPFIIKKFPFEISGPASLRFVPPMSQFKQFITYSLSDDFINLGESGYLQNPSGQVELVVEKSTDLMSWSPLIAKQVETVNGEKEFFRIRIAR